jgi:molecular chaperone DnaJ
MPTTRRDYYEVLGVPRDADASAIKDAFRQLALKYHPDRNREPGAEERFKEIAEAYAVLSDPRKRSDYDARGFAGVAGIPPEDLFAGVDFGDIFGDLGGLFGGGFFDRFVGRRRRAGPPHGADLEVELTVPLERVAGGGEETVRVRHPATCAACHGSGARAGTAPRACTACGGSGQQVSGGRRGGVMVQQISTCAACRGRGTIIEQPCPDCGGRGEVARDEALTVTIPAGVEEGTALRIPGRGMPAPGPGAAPGDLFVVVRSAADPRFVRDGADLWRAESLEVADAVLGTTRTVPTLSGDATVTVPAGTQPGSVLRLKGKGLPHFGGRGRGDLYLRVHLHVPERLTAEERKLYERLRAMKRNAS